MATPALIYCADGNKRFAEIAIDAGFLYGARLPARGLPFDPYFADQDYKNPNRGRYMTELEKCQPYMASVIDWSKREELSEVLSWAEDAARFVQVVMLIPKVVGGVAKLPRVIGGRPVRLGYSVRTKYGGTPVPLYEFIGWPVHLLGGGPSKQIYLSAFLDVVSVDGNYSQKMATKYNEFWMNGKWHELSEHGGRVDHDAPYEAFKRSCENIIAAWRGQNGQ